MTRVPAGHALSPRHLGRELHSLVRGVRHGALARTQTFLCMCRDDGNGRMGLVRNRLRVVWHDAGLQAPFKRISRRLAELTRLRKGSYVINPFWSRLFGRRLITVHPLGGCAMGDDASTGVVDSYGRVFNPGGAANSFMTHLYVCDGSIVPAALGRQPGADHLGAGRSASQLRRRRHPDGRLPRRSLDVSIPPCRASAMRNGCAVR